MYLGFNKDIDFAEKELKGNVVQKIAMNLLFNLTNSDNYIEKYEDSFDLLKERQIEFKNDL